MSDNVAEFKAQWSRARQASGSQQCRMHGIMLAKMAEALLGKASVAEELQYNNLKYRAVVRNVSSVSLSLVCPDLVRAYPGGMRIPVSAFTGDGVNAYQKDQAGPSLVVKRNATDWHGRGSPVNEYSLCLLDSTLLLELTMNWSFPPVPWCGYTPGVTVVAVLLKHKDP